MKKLAFGTDGWRAIIAEDFTISNVKIVAEAIARYTIETDQQAKGIIVGHDTRFMGRRFAEEVVRVLASHQITAYLVNEATPTPVVAFGVKHFATSGAIMLTASHNPPEYNGMKYIPHYAGPATPEVTQRLEELISQVQAEAEVSSISLVEARANKQMEYIYLRPHYEAHLQRMVRFDKIKEAGLTIAVDPMHGAGIGYVSTILEDAGVATITIRDEIDPSFGGDLPEPNEKHLRELAKVVQENKCDLGLANDGDADRFGIIDRFGQYVPSNQVLTLLTRHLIKNRALTGRIVRTVATTHLLDKIAEQHGLQLVETPVGFKYIGAEMRAEDVLIGGEESGGCSILQHIPEKDGILINLLIVEMCAWEGKPLDQILHELHAEYGEYFSTRIDVRLQDKESWLSELVASPPVAIGPFAVEKVERKDGIKLLLAEDSWVLIRPSGTEPLLRIYCEAATALGLEQLKDAINDLFIGVNV